MASGPGVTTSRESAGGRATVTGTRWVDLSAPAPREPGAFGVVRAS